MGLARASSGMPGLDRVLDDLRLGDNVVWQVETVDDYRHFVEPFAAAAIGAGKRLVYCRFGRHPALLEPQEGLEIRHLEAGRGFEQFSTEIHGLAAAQGEGTYYIFDCLSELLSEWSTDLMIGNFFLVTCPYLFELQTIAYFALLRGRHSHQTIARIRDTTQLLIDACRLGERFYVHPLKVWRRYSPTMFLPHIERGEELSPLTNSADAAQLLTLFPERGLGKTGRRLDYWDQIFLQASEAPPGEREVHRERLLRTIIGRDEKILALARTYLRTEDLLRIKSRLIGSGFIGGKAVGLLLARAILAADPGYRWAEILEPHDSFFVGADVYYTFLVENGCWQWRQDQKKEEHYFSAARLLKERIAQGAFPEAVRDQFLEMLEYFGQAPIIVRSSSLLEDSFGNAFAGKYESVFCPNQGDLAERYAQFLAAVRRVYASTMNEAALLYRRQRGLAKSDEQMALLVQRVSGARRGTYFYPDLAGVALSRNLYVWREDMDPGAGMLRLVLGLGTRAVDRTGDDYARHVPLDHPLRRPENPEEQRHYTQRDVDLLDLGEGCHRALPVSELAQRGLIARVLLTAVHDPENAFWFPNFDRLLGQTAFPSLMRGMLQTLEAAYGHPVDTEFTVNLRGGRELSLNLLQCRPLQLRYDQRKVSLPAGLPNSRILLAARSHYMGSGLALQVARLVYVVPEEYAVLTATEKYEVARVVGRLNELIDSPGEQPAILLGPGRWGTKTPSLGLPVSFAEIDRFTILGELAFVTAGYVPELSYGTHFFQDLIESGLSYLAVDERETGGRLNRDFFLQHPNALGALLPQAESWGKVIRVVDCSALGEEILFVADPLQQQVLCWLADPADPHRLLDTGYSGR